MRSENDPSTLLHLSGLVDDRLDCLEQLVLLNGRHHAVPRLLVSAARALIQLEFFISEKNELFNSNQNMIRIHEVEGYSVRGVLQRSVIDAAHVMRLRNETAIGISIFYNQMF